MDDLSLDELYEIMSENDLQKALEAATDIIYEWKDWHKEAIEFIESFQKTKLDTIKHEQYLSGLVDIIDIIEDDENHPVKKHIRNWYDYFRELAQDREKSYTVRSYAISFLSSFSYLFDLSEEIFPIIKNLYNKENNFEFKKDIIWEIARMGADLDSVMTSFMKIINEDEKELKLEAIDAITEFAFALSDDYISYFQNLLYHKDNDVRIAAIETISFYEDGLPQLKPEILNLYKKEKNKEVKKEIWKHFIRKSTTEEYEKKSIPQLIKEIENKKIAIEQRQTAIRKLSRFQNKEATDYLLKISQKYAEIVKKQEDNKKVSEQEKMDNKSIYWESYNYLANSVTEDTFLDTIRELEQRNDKHSRYSLLRIFYKFEKIPDEFIQLIRQLLIEFDFDLSNFLARTIKRLPEENFNWIEEEAIKLLEEFNNDEKKYAIIQQLGLFGKEKSAKKLIDMLYTDGDKYVRREVASALGEIQIRNSELIVTNLIKALETDKDVWTRKRIIESLSNFSKHASDIIPVLLKMREGETKIGVKNKIKATLERIAEKLEMNSVDQLISKYE